MVSLYEIREHIYNFTCSRANRKRNYNFHVMLRSVDLTRRLPEKQVVKAIKRNLLFDPVPPPEDVSESKRARILPYWAPRYICVLWFITYRIRVLLFMYVFSYLCMCSLIYAHLAALGAQARRFQKLNWYYICVLFFLCVLLFIYI